MHLLQVGGKEVEWTLGFVLSDITHHHQHSSNSGSGHTSGDNSNGDDNDKDVLQEALDALSLDNLIDENTLTFLKTTMDFVTNIEAYTEVAIEEVKSMTKYVVEQYLLYFKQLIRLPF